MVLYKNYFNYWITIKYISLLYILILILLVIDEKDISYLGIQIFTYFYNIYARLFIFTCIIHSPSKFLIQQVKS